MSAWQHGTSVAHSSAQSEHTDQAATGLSLCARTHHRGSHNDAQSDTDDKRRHDTHRIAQ